MIARTTQLDPETEFEKNQRFNALVAWLHSLRYKHIFGVFKAFARQRAGQRIKVVEIGCAHAKLFPILHKHFDVDYTGIEINPEFVETARLRHAHHPNFHLIHQSVTTSLEQIRDADIIVALETFEHIPEHDVVRIMEGIAAAKPSLFVCSVPVEIGPALWLKNVGSLLTGYMRHEGYSWAETFWAGLYQLDRLPPHGITHQGFDWRWLAQTIRHNMKILKIRTLPFAYFFLPHLRSRFSLSQSREGSRGSRKNNNHS